MQGRIQTDWLAEPTHGGLVFAIVGGLGAHDLPVLRRMHLHAGTAMALALDVDAWVGNPATGGNAQTLARSGWRAASFGPRDRLDAVWQELGRAAAQSSRTGRSTVTSVGEAFS